jgi:hypothetical protein
MKFMLLIGGSHAEWDQVSPADWEDSQKVHADLIAELKASGEFVDCNELNVTPAGARIIRTTEGIVTSVDGPLHDSGDFASGFYLLECRDIDRASEIAARLYESRFAPIEVRRVGE